MKAVGATGALLCVLGFGVLLFSLFSQESYDAICFAAGTAFANGFALLLSK